MSESEGWLLPEVADLSGDASHQLVAGQLDEHRRRRSGNDDGLHWTQVLQVWGLGHHGSAIFEIGCSQINFGRSKEYWILEIENISFYQEQNKTFSVTEKDE